MSKGPSLTCSWEVVTTCKGMGLTVVYWVLDSLYHLQ